MSARAGRRRRSAIPRRAILRARFHDSRPNRPGPRWLLLRHLVGRRPGRELLTGNQITKWNWQTGRMDRLFTAEGCASTRQQVHALLSPTSSAIGVKNHRTHHGHKELRIFTTTIRPSIASTRSCTTPNTARRSAWQNVAYNQPPWTSFFLGFNMKPAPSQHRSRDAEIGRPVPFPGSPPHPVAAVIRASQVIAPREGARRPSGAGRSAWLLVAFLSSHRRTVAGRKRPVFERHFGDQAFAVPAVWMTGRTRFRRTKIARIQAWYRATAESGEHLERLLVQVF